MQKPRCSEHASHTLVHVNILGRLGEVSFVSTGLVGPESQFYKQAPREVDAAECMTQSSMASAWGWFVPALLGQLGTGGPSTHPYPPFPD